MSYFLGTGFGLIASLAGYFVIVDGPTTIRSLGTFTALGFSGSLPYLGYWLGHSDLSDSEVWTVARWCGLGIGVATLLIVVAILLGVGARIELQFPHLFVNLIALGGVLGALTGLIRQLGRKNDRVAQLNQRNTVLNRVLRHNVRNDINVITGHLDLIASELDGERADLLEPIRRKSNEIIEMSRAARHIQSIENLDEDPAVDLIPYIETQIQTVRETHPSIAITTDLPEQAWADVGPLVQTVIDNLLENAIEHNDRQPRIHVAVETAPDAVTVEVADNGPGIPEQELCALTGEESDQITHGSGLGLWLVLWFVENADGTLSFERNQPRGTKVRMTLPATRDGPSTATPPFDRSDTLA
ncbi:MAG: ATP-binding protein [Haloplanus sp.]